MVSVCIASWNCRRLLRACLRSLHEARQRIPLEIIVVDNASTDGAADMVERLFPRVKLIRNTTNRGFAAANNQAAAAAQGRYLFFLNNDTVLPRGALRRLVRHARAHPEAAVIGPRLLDSQGKTQVSWRARPTVAALLHHTFLFRWTGLFRRAYRRYRGRREHLQTTQPVEVLMGAALLMRRKHFQRHGGWDESYTFGGEDIDLCARLGRKRPIIYHPEVSITHHGRASSRLHIGYVHTNTLVGITQFLRRSGSSRLAMLAYKLAMTVDAPLQLIGQASRYLWRRCSGQPIKAAKSKLALRGALHFLSHGLIPLWKT